MLLFSEFINCLVFRKKDLYLIITQKLTFMKSAGFCADFTKSGGFHVKSTYKTYKSNISRKTLQFYGVLWEGYVMFSHEIRRISKDQQLPGMVRPMFCAVFNSFTGMANEARNKCSLKLFLSELFLHFSRHG